MSKKIVRSKPIDIHSRRQFVQMWGHFQKVRLFVFNAQDQANATGRLDAAQSYHAASQLVAGAEANIRAACRQLFNCRPEDLEVYK